MSYILYQSSIAPEGITIPDDNSDGISNSIIINDNNSTISKVEIVLHDIKHAYVGDLFIKLTKESSVNPNEITTLVIMNSPGPGTLGSSGNDFANTIITDDSTVSIEAIDSSDEPWTNMEFHPSDGSSRTFLSIFNGKDVNGTWTLSVADNSGYITGTLYSWHLRIYNSEDVPSTQPDTPPDNEFILYKSSIGPNGKNIPDRNGTGVSDSIIITNNNSTVSGIEIVLVIVKHTHVGDLTVSLTKENPEDSSNNTTIVLMDRPGSGPWGVYGEDFDNTILTDNSEQSIESIEKEGAPWPHEKFYPHDGSNQTFLNIFNGEEVNGTWTLTMVDNAGGDTGTLYEWHLRIYNPEPVQTTTATSCFTGEAKVKTDQGLIQIKDVTIKNTINNKKIKGISKTIWPMDKIVVIEKHALGHNYPSTKTKVAPTHRFLINETLQPIMNFVNNENIYLTKYKNETLYNVILDKGIIMNVNNMDVETLDPNALIAKVFDGSLDASQKNRLIKSLNKYHTQLKKKPLKTIKDYRV